VLQCVAACCSVLQVDLYQGAHAKRSVAVCFSVLLD